MRKFLVIDGYNLLFEMAKLSRNKITTNELNNLRDDLVQKVANFAALSGQETILVFDGSSMQEEELVLEESGIQVVFTKKEETADTFIERFLYEMPRTYETVLITSDGAVQEMALLTGAQRFSSRQFITDMNLLERDHQKYANQHQDKTVNIFGDHLTQEEKELFEKIRRGILD